MQQSSAKNPWLFYALVAYVLMQFLWWEVLLAKQTGQLADGQKNIAALNYADKTVLEENLKQIEQKKTRKLYMHLGEGAVFLILLSLGVLKIYNTRKKENELILLQNNFLLSVTHELKSPLASVKLQLQTMQKHKLDEATQNSLLQKALADNERLMRLIDNILLASGTQQEKLLLNKEKINLSQLLYKLHEQVFEKDKERIKISSESNYFIDVDERVVSIIFSNLIENALKYSPQNAEVEITARQSGNLVSVEFKDNGFGIPADEKQRVFEKFYRIGNEETRSTKGTGLGLYIVKNLCALHDIDVSVSDNKPKGTVFTLSFK
jgi:two-component system, OmpR family, sensor histidine kinase CiaH